MFLYYVKYLGDFDPMFTYRIFILITLPYLVFSILKLNFFKIYEHIIAFLSLISLPLYFLQILNSSAIYSTISSIQNLFNIPNMPWKGYASILLYTVNYGQGSGVYRNCGFAWEPGGFATFILLAIIINLASNKFNYKNKTLFVLILALLTTFSTTGYAAFSLIFIWTFINHKSKRKLILIPVIIGFIFYGFSLSFMKDKVYSLSENPKNLLRSTSILSLKTGNSYSLGRFAGLLMNWEDFKENPILGYGGHVEDTWRKKNNVRVASINGLGRWMAMYGFVGVFIFIYAYLKSFKNLSKIYDFSNYFLLFFVILIISFAFNIIQTPLFFTFMLSNWFIQYKEI
jgi:hypothetical protein